MKRCNRWIVAASLVGLYVGKPVSAQQAGDPFTAKDAPAKAGYVDRLYVLNGGYGHSGNAGLGNDGVGRVRPQRAGQPVQSGMYSRSACQALNS